MYLSSCIAQWQVMLFKYDIIYMKWKVVKGSAITDHQVDNVIDDYKPIKFEFSNESITVVSGDWGW